MTLKPNPTTWTMSNLETVYLVLEGSCMNPVSTLDEGAFSKLLNLAG